MQWTIMRPACEVSAEQAKAARDEYDNVWVRFNLRARGEFDQPHR
jgi:hypothetical protein